MTRALLIAGTNGWRDGWCTDPTHPFVKLLAGQDIARICRPDGRAWRWSTVLDGLFGDDETWIAAGEALADFLDLYVPVRDRNLIAHSHGGNVAAITAQLVPLNTLTTVGTPPRPNIDYFASAKNIVYWQHIHDAGRDTIAWLGKVRLGDHRFAGFDRRMPAAPNVVNCALRGIGHSKLLRDEKVMHYWIERGWLSAIKTHGVVQGV